MASSKNVRKRRRTPGDLLQFLALSVIAGFVAALILVPPTTALSATANASINWFKGLPDTLSEGPLSEPSVIYARDGKTELASYYAQNRTEITLDDMSQHMKDAILSSEDRNFYEHGAVSPMGIARAVINNVVNPGARQGASTLTQQYVNNLLIDAAEQTGSEAGTLGANKDYLDKVKEIKLAISMEQNLSKDEILEGYLNIINLGGSNYGVESAAYYYWGISASELDISQSAILAGMVVSPNVYRPDVNPQLSKERRDVVLGTMFRDGKITEDEYSSALNEDIELDIHTTPMGCSTARDAAHFCYYAVTDFLNDEAFGATEDDRANALYRGGYKIITTLDAGAQAEAKEQVEATQPSSSNVDDVNTALVSVEPSNGNIVVMAQNSAYGEQDETNQSSYFNFNVGTSHGGTAGFQPGSTYKPILLAQWIKDGKGVNATIDGTALHYPQSFRWPASCVEGGFTQTPDLGGYTFQNAEGGNQSWGTVAFGMKNSINSYTMKMASVTDACAVNDLRSAMHITDGTGNDEPYSLDQPSAYIGGWTNGTTPLIMASAYAVFASGGMYCEPKSLNKVEKAKTGEEIKAYESTCERVMEEDVANGVNYVLKQVLVDGSGYQRGIGLTDASAAKTGTTDNSTQTWTVGYTRGLSTASWVGSMNEGSRSLNGLSINGRSLSYVDGATYAGLQWQRFMQAEASNFNTDRFDTPSNAVLGYNQ